MNDLDQRIRSDLDRVVSTAPPPLPIETILARGKPGLEPEPWSYRSWTVTVAVLAAAAGLVVIVMGIDGPRPGPGVDVEAAETSGTDTSSQPTEVAAVETDIAVRSGLWLSEIVPEIADQLPGITEREFWAALEQGDPEPPFTSASGNLAGVDVPGLTSRQLRWEGLLAPGTYSIAPDSTAADVIDQLHDEFRRTISDLGYDQAAERLGLSPYEIVVIASLVETADPGNDDDRGKIATVIYNRLNEGIPLAIDASLIYENGIRGEVPTRGQIDAITPYNIRHPASRGLPPTPIAAPSRASLRAAIDPTPGPWRFYVVGDQQSNYYFATTLAEHNNNLETARENGLFD